MMSSKNVKDACDEHDLVTPCYDDVYHKGPECHITGTDYTLNMLSAFFCGSNRNYQQCPILLVTLNVKKIQIFDNSDTKNL